MKNFIKLFVPTNIKVWWWTYRNDRRVAHNPSRVFLMQTILPIYIHRLPKGSNVLWVGCTRYTKNVCKLFEKAGITCYTIEIDPTLAKWGSKHHIVGDVRDLPFVSGKFDAVFCTGIFGYGVDSQYDQETAVSAMTRVLKPSGLLLFSWNMNKSFKWNGGEMPIDVFNRSQWEPISLIEGASKYIFNGGPSVYESYKKTIQ